MGKEMDKRRLREKRYERCSLQNEEAVPDMATFLSIGH